MVTSIERRDENRSTRIDFPTATVSGSRYWSSNIDGVVQNDNRSLYLVADHNMLDDLIFIMLLLCWRGCELSNRVLDIVRIVHRLIHVVVVFALRGEPLGRQLLPGYEIYTFPVFMIAGYFCIF